MERNFTAVVADILGNVPPEETLLFNRIQKINMAAGFRAPEQRHIDWMNLCECLEDELGSRDSTPWIESIRKIITAEV